MSQWNRFAAGSALLVFLASIPSSACRKKEIASRSVAPLPTVSAPAASATAAHQHGPYPPARWRLASAEELDRSVLWVSHILIRHRDSTTQAPFVLADWRPLPAPPERSRNEALVLAQRLEGELRARPELFERFEREHSEDDTVRPFGGKLGAVTAFYVSQWPAILDAVAALTPGGVSRVVETEYGYHIVRREPAPTPALIAGRRLVIGYNDAPWLGFNARPGKPAVARSRSEARELAGNLARRLQAAPDLFEQAVREHSELSDASRAGDLGVWSNREPSRLPIELMVLRGLEVGAVSEPVDTYLGFQILVRDPVTERAPYAASVIRLVYDPKAPDSSDASRRAMGQRAQSISRALQKDPEQFPRFQDSLCCTKPEIWTRGREPNTALATIASLREGEITETLESESSFIIARRIDPATIPAAIPVVFDVPAPAAPELDRLVRVTESHALAKFCRQFGEGVSSKLSLSDEVVAKLDALHTELATAFEKTDEPKARVNLLGTTFAQLRSLLGDASYREYRGLLDAEVESQLGLPHGHP
jgi:hypothetical protein